LGANVAGGSDSFNLFLQALARFQIYHGLAIDNLVAVRSTYRDQNPYENGVHDLLLTIQTLDGYVHLLNHVNLGDHAFKVVVFP
jgi:hypothetical protein